MAMSAEYRSKFSALQRQWWRLHMSEKISSGKKKTKKQSSKFTSIECLKINLKSRTKAYKYQNAKLKGVSCIKRGKNAFWKGVRSPFKII